MHEKTQDVKCPNDVSHKNITLRMQSDYYWNETLGKWTKYQDIPYSIEYFCEDCNHLQIYPDYSKVK